MFIHTKVGMNRLASKRTSPYLFHFNQEKKKEKKIQSSNTCRSSLFMRPITCTNHLYSIQHSTNYLYF